jgi:hypothetical protein
LGLVDKLEDLPHDHRAGDLKAVNGLFLEADRHQRLVDLFGGEGLWQLDELAKPGQWDTH